MAKERLDVILVKRGLAESREQAQRLVYAGQIRSNGEVLDKPGHKHEEDLALELESLPRFVSRGGLKLEEAFEKFGLNVAGMTCLDVGSSTGGFTDCMLQHGAAMVFAVDVGKGQLHWKIRSDERVVVMEGINARYLKPDDLKGVPEFATADVSFISLTKILPAVFGVLKKDATIVTLIKPQFEAGRGQVGKGGVVKDPVIHEEVVERIRRFGIEELGLECVGVVESPVKGPAGNVEFLAVWRKGLGAKRSEDRSQKSAGSV